MVVTVTQCRRAGDQCGKRGGLPGSSVLNTMSCPPLPWAMSWEVSPGIAFIQAYCNEGFGMAGSFLGLEHAGMWEAFVGIELQGRLNPLTPQASTARGQTEPARKLRPAKQTVCGEVYRAGCVSARLSSVCALLCVCVCACVCAFVCLNSPTVSSSACLTSRNVPGTMGGL